MRVGIVGLGFRMGAVLQNFRHASPELVIAGYVDPEPAGLPVLRKAGIDTGRRHHSLGDLLEQEQIDLLMVGSPNHMHLDHIRAGLEKGLRVFSEKPVVTTREQSFELARLLKRHGHDKVMVGLVLRYSPLYRDLRRVHAEGRLGEITSIEASEHIAPYHGAFFMRDWRRYTKYAGNYMLEKCCHDLDLYQGLVGCRPQRVASFGGRKSFVPAHNPELQGINDLEVYHRKPSGWQGTDRVFDSDADIVDYQSAIIEYANGANLSFTCNLNVPDEFRHFCVIGSHGMAEGDFVRNYFRVHDARSAEKVEDKTYAVSAYSGHYGADEQMAVDLVNHFRTGETLPVGAIDALEAGLTAIEIDHARASRSVIDLTETWRSFDEALGIA